jgi:hypothetical protein
MAIYGVRWYGKVHAHGEQYIATRFFHLNFLPLIPLGSMWVISEQEHQVGSKTEKVFHGMELSLHLLSVVTAYMRTWAPVLGIFMCLHGNLLGGVPLLGLYLLSWVWYRANDEQGPQLMARAAGQKLRPQLQDPKDPE